MRKIFTTLLCLFAFFSSSLSYAYTLDEICAFGGYVMQSNNYTYAFDKGAYTGYVNSFGTKFDRVEGSDTRLILTAFRHDALTLSGAQDYAFEFYLSDKSGNETTDGAYLAVAANASSTTSSKYKLQKCTVSRTSYTVDTSNPILFKLVKNSTYGTFTMTSQSGVHLYLNGSSSKKAFVNVLFETFEPNMFVTQTIEEYAASGYESHLVKTYDITYPIQLNISGSKFTIKNFANRGRRMGASASSSQPRGSSTLSDIAGTVTTSTKTLTFTANQWSSVNICYLNATWKVGEYFLRACNLSTQTALGSGTTLKATYDDTKGIHHNASVEEGWVTNGGSRRTIDGMSLQFSNGYGFTVSRTSNGANTTTSYVYKSTSGGHNAWLTSGSIYNVFTPMVYTRKTIANDVTLDAEIDLQQYNCEDGWLYFKGEIVLNKNFDYVAENDGIDLFIVPGNYTSISDSGFSVDNEIGHKKAFCISDSRFDTDLVGKPLSAPSRIAASEASSDGKIHIPFCKALNVSELGENTNAEGLYSIFLRANYAEDTELTPTFHALSYIARNVTALDGPQVDNSATTPTYYNLQGVRMEGEPATPGVYVRRQGTRAEKVVIR